MSLLRSFVFECDHSCIDTTQCPFYRFPKDENVRREWATMCKRADAKPSNSSQVCSCHSIDEKKENGFSTCARGKVVKSVQGNKKKHVLRADAKPSISSQVCSCHSIDEKKENCFSTCARGKVVKSVQGNKKKHVLIPNSQRSLHDTKEKESTKRKHTSSFNSTMATTTIRSDTVNTDCSPYANSPQSLTSSPQAERNVKILKVYSIPGYVIAVYSDDIEMWIAKNGVYFLDSNKNRLDERTRSELKKRYEKDLKSVLLKALPKDV